MHIFSLWSQSEQEEHTNLTHSHLSQKPACCEGTFLTTALLCLLQILSVSGHPLTSVSFVTVHKVVVYTFAWQAIDLIKWCGLTHCGNPLWIREYPKVGFGVWGSSMTLASAILFRKLGKCSGNADISFSQWQGLRWTLSPLRVCEASGFQTRDWCLKFAPTPYSVLVRSSLHWLHYCISLFNYYIFGNIIDFRFAYPSLECGVLYLRYLGDIWEWHWHDKLEKSGVSSLSQETLDDIVWACARLLSYLLVSVSQSQTWDCVHLMSAAKITGAAVFYLWK